MSVKELQGSFFFPTTYDLPPAAHLRVSQCPCISTHTYIYTQTAAGHTHTQATQKLWIGCNNWSRWQGRNIIHSHGVSCHRWQADINIPQPLCQGLMAVHHATVTHRTGVHTHTDGTGTFTGIARSLMEMEERVRGGQEATGDGCRYFWISMFTFAQINRFLQKIQPTLANTTLRTTHNTHFDSSGAYASSCLAVLFSTLLKTLQFFFSFSFFPQTHLVLRQSGAWHL